MTYRKVKKDLEKLIKRILKIKSPSQWDSSFQIPRKEVSEMFRKALEDGLSVHKNDK